MGAVLIRGIFRVFSGVGLLVLATALVLGSPTPAAAGEFGAGRSLEPGAEAPVQIAAADEDDANDPLEPMNRFFFGVNEFLTALILRPLAEFYAGLMPPPVREAIGNALDNMESPVVLVNDILQGEGKRALETAGRLAINTTVGVGGLYDAADKLFGIEGHDEDFGQTLGAWGVGEGFYLVLPILGPSNPRDAIGEHVIDAFFDPINLWAANTDREGIKWGRAGVGAIHKYSGLMDELAQTKKTSIDYYATIRSIFRQKREADIRNGDDVDLPPIPDLTPDISFDGGEDGDTGKLPIHD